MKPWVLRIIKETGGGGGGGGGGEWVGTKISQNR